jgi:dUTPase
MLLILLRCSVLELIKLSDIQRKYRLAYANSDSPGFSIPSAESGEIPPGRARVFSTGLWLIHDMPLWRRWLARWFVFELQIRTDLRCVINYGVTVLGAPITISADHSSEILIALHNHTDETHIIDKGDIIAQGVVGLAWRARGVPVTTSGNNR